MFQKKIISGWFKGIHNDSEDLILETLEVLTNSVVNDGSVTKSAKIAFFNDWLMGYMIKLFDRSDKVPELLAELMTTLCTNSERGVRFQDKSWYGTTINNKLLLTVLKKLKPWDDMLQQDLGVNILKNSPELVSAYTSSIGDSISYDPKLSSFWVSYTAFYTRLVSLPIPELDSVIAPPTETVVENIIPQTLSKPALNKSLTNETPLIRYFASELLVKGLLKLKKLVLLYETRKWDTSSLLAEVLQRLPEVQTLSTCLATLQEGDLLKAVVLKLSGLYCELFPESVLSAKMALPSEYIDGLQRLEGLTGVKLVQARNTLTVQARISKAGKWYNKSGKYSTFTNLLRLGALNPPLKSQVEQLIIGLTRPFLLFQIETLAHPVSALFSSLDVVTGSMDGEQQSKLWSYIDETVARCMRSPYKYVDEFTTLGYSGVLSPFIVTLLEQWRFLQDPKDQIKDWVLLYLRYSRIIGECGPAILQLCEDAGITGSVSHSFDGGNIDKILAGNNQSVQVQSEIDLQAVKCRIQEAPRDAEKLLPLVSLELANSIAKKAFFEDILSLESVASVYFPTLKKICASVEVELSDIRNATEQLPEDIRCEGLWLGISNNVESSDGYIIAKIIQSKTEAGIALTPQEVEIYLTRATRNVAYVEKALEESFSNIMTAQVNERDLGRIMEFLFINNEQLLCSLVKSTGRFLLGEEEATHSIKLAAAIAEHTTLKNEAIFVNMSSRALEVLQQNEHDGEEFRDSIVILSRACQSLDASTLEKLQFFFESVDGNITVSREIILLAESLYHVKSEGIEIWAQKVVQWLIKSFSSGVDKLSSMALDFAKDLSWLLRTVPIQQLVSAKRLNVLVEILSQNLLRPEAVSLLTSVVFSAGRSITLNHQQILSKLISTVTAKTIDATSALLLWKLVTLDAKSQSTEKTQDLIIQLCGGTRSVVDIILLDVIKRIEAQLNTSWVNRVHTWNFSADDNRPLFKSTEDGTSVSLNTNMIKHSVQNFDPNASLVLETTRNLGECLRAIENFQICYESFDSYDSEFLLMSIVSSPELFKDNGSIDIKTVVESGSLAFTITCISHPVLAPTSHAIIGALLRYFQANSESSEEITYKERATVRILLYKIMSILESEKDEIATLESCIWSILAQLVSVVCNPGHFLYPRAMEYLLSGPTILQDIPLYKSITTRSDENLVRQYHWLIDVLTTACQTQQDVALYLKRGVFEWALGLNQSPYMHVESKVRALIAKVQETPHGSLSVITRNAGLGWTELNSSKLGVRFILTAQDEDQRLEQWTSCNIDGTMRRLTPTTV